MSNSPNNHLLYSNPDIANFDQTETPFASVVITSPSHFNLPEADHPFGNIETDKDIGTDSAISTSFNIPNFGNTEIFGNPTALH